MMENKGAKMQGQLFESNAQVFGVSSVGLDQVTKNE
jgi:hypothetical protein